MNVEEMRKEFDTIYSLTDDVRGYIAPGRVNLIGEHIDYNGGHVFPCAITFGNYVLARKREDRRLRFYSSNYKKGGIYETSLDDLHYYKAAFWTNYPKGVFWSFIKNGYNITHGFDIYVYGSIPGSGLSSSAAMEVSMAYLLKDQFGFDVDGIKIAKMCQEAENTYCGMNCGIMDQFASSMGKKDMAMFLDCASLKFDYVPVKLDGYKIVVTNSRKPHSLASSHYNDRRKECERALRDIQKRYPIKNLCELPMEKMPELSELIKDNSARMRASFAISEEDRTKAAVKALKENNIQEFGELLNASGDGLRYLYDATCFEIDTLVDAARKQEGCVGARETGGGWGGNIISVVREDKVHEFIYRVSEEYARKTHLRSESHVLNVGDGGRRIF